MDPIASSSGVNVQPHERLRDPATFDYIAVIGGLSDGVEKVSPAYKRYLCTAAAAGVPLIGICGGAFVLHRTGLLDGYKCCVSWFHHGDFLEGFEGLDPVSDQIFVVDRDRLTCSGGASAAHLAAHLVERYIGRSQARRACISCGRARAVRYPRGHCAVGTRHCESLPADPQRDPVALPEVLTVAPFIRIGLGCATAIPTSGDAICAGTRQARAEQVAALVEDGGDRSVLSGQRLVAILDAACTW